MKEINTKQCALIILFSACAFKLLMLPSLMTRYVGQDVWLVFLLMFLLDSLYFFLFLTIANHHRDKSLYEVLENSFGKVITKTIYFLLGLYFAIKVIFLIKESNMFFAEALYESLTWPQFILPILLLIAYMAAKGFKPLGRTLEIVVVLVFPIIVLSIIINMFNVDLTNLLPVFTHNFSSVLQTAFTHSFWFGDFTIFFILVSKIKIEKNFIKSSTIAWTIGCAITLLLVIVFWCTFTRTSTMQRFAINDISLKTIQTTFGGELSSFVVIAMCLANIFFMGIFSNCAVESWKLCFETKKTNIFSLIFSIITISIILTTSFNVNLYIRFMQGPLRFFAIFIQYFLPAFLPLAIYAQRRKEVKT